MLSGAIGGLMGVGGGIILVPLLVHVLHVSQHEAQGSSLAFIIATALVAAIPYYTHERLDLVLALCLAAGAVPGVIAGSRIAAATPAARLRIAFGAIIFFTAVRLIAAPPQGFGEATPWPAWINVLLGVAVGILAGLLGVGGGTMLVPVLVLGQDINQHSAQGVSLLMIVPVGIAGVFSYSRRGRLLVSGLPPLLAGGAVGALAGAMLAHRTNAPTLTRLFALFLFGVAAQMILRPPRDMVSRSEVTQEGVP